jgi:hypothetical protein
MTYLGNTPTTQSFISGTDYFNGTGSQTAFTLSRTVASINDIQVTVNNVVQQPNDAYTISGTTLTMTSAPSSGTNNVYVRYLSTTTQAITPSQNTVSWNTLDSNIQQDLGVMFKNRIINGNMVIDQRNAGAGAVTVQQSSTAPTGFTNSMSLTVATADTSIGAAQYYQFFQIIEGYNVADLNFGSVNAKTITVSFWVRSSKIGTYNATLLNGAANRLCPVSFTINSANTWEYKTFTVAGDQTGTWLTTNGGGLYLSINLALGSNFNSGTSGTWNGSSQYGVSSQVNWLDTVGATFYITGVQLEVGTQATTFTTAGGSYGAELALCQRYFYRHLNASAVSGWNPNMIAQRWTADQAHFSIPCPVPLRTTPSISKSGTMYIYAGGTSITLGGVIAVPTNYSNFTCYPSVRVTATGITGNTAWTCEYDTSAYFEVSAEL